MCAKMGGIENTKDQLFPEGGCDTHHHIFERRYQNSIRILVLTVPAHNFPYSPNRHLTPPKATLEEYNAFKKSLGITHSVLMHGLSYGYDCSSLKAFIKKLGPSKTRGCAVIDEQTSEVEIDALHESGIRRIRPDLYRYDAIDNVEKIQVLRRNSQRVALRGWFLEFLQTNPWNWARLGEVIPTLGLQVVVDHHALLKAQSMLPKDVDVLSQPGLAEIVELLKTGNFWIKISAPYRSSTLEPHYEDMRPLTLSLLNANPRRVLWGSDW
jgi:predicted TIM-barrel fold metal-dependent hydrolase